MSPEPRSRSPLQRVGNGYRELPQQRCSWRHQKACARSHRLYPCEVHIAEKLHAYTMPRPRPNGRVKDLPDIALLALTGPFESAHLRQSFRKTFDERGTHAVPVAVPEPPAGLWEKPYDRLARINQLRWKDLAGALTAARQFLDPVLGGTDGTWDPGRWQWRG